MNYITLTKIKDFNTVINSSLVLTRCIDEEINFNMWGITLKKSLAAKISIEELQSLINIFLAKKREQVTELNVPATCYIWVDEQSFLLNINIITGHIIKLPFGCKVNLVKNLKPLLQKFIELSKKGIIPWSDVILVNETSDEEDDPINYILDVYSYFM